MSNLRVSHPAVCPKKVFECKTNYENISYFCEILVITYISFMGQLLKDFKDFAMKGNVVDMAVGVIIGGAFGKIVSSLVNDIIMPVISLCTGSVNFSELSATLRPEIKDAAGEVINQAVTFNYGMFIQNIIDFIIIAFSIFMALRFMMKFKKKETEAPAAPAAPSKEEELLTQIRDLLKEKK